MKAAGKVYVLEYRNVDRDWILSVDAPVFRKRKAAQRWRKESETRKSMRYRVVRFDRHV